MNPTKPITRPSGLKTTFELTIGIFIAIGLAGLVQFSWIHESWPRALMLTAFSFLPLIGGLVTLWQWLTVPPATDN